MRLGNWFEAIGLSAVQRILQASKRRGNQRGARPRAASQMMEQLESRVMLTVNPVVQSINRSSPAMPITALSAVNYAVTFSQSVTGVVAADFNVLTSGPVAASNTVQVSGSGSSYTVTVSGIHGNGNLQLEALGGQSAYNGSFVGQSYTILQPGPTVLSINRSNPSGSSAPGPSVTFAVTFSTSVTGVALGDFTAPALNSDFQVATGGGMTYSDLAVSGSGSSYTVTVNGISGNGSLGLNLVDKYTIHDLAGNPLQSNAATSASFSARQTFNTTFKANSIAVADMNGDGIPDLIEANDNNNVGVLLGNGNGTFQPVQTFGAGSKPVSVAVADVNGDGKLDVIVANRNGFPGIVSVLLGNGNGTLQPQATYAVGSTPESVTVTDTNGDGKPDIVVANQSSANISILLGNGNGTFGAQHTFATAAYPRSVAVADLNGDGKPDLVAPADNTNAVSVLLGNGNGTFQASQTYATGSFPYGVAIADVSGDGIPDIIATDNFGYSVAVLKGNGDGTFQTATTFSTSSFSRAVAVADVNGDGNPDLLVANVNSTGNGPGSAGLLLGNGNGTFQAQQALEFGTNPTSIAVADLNLDGKPDLITNGGSNTVDVLLGTGVGNFTGQTYTIAPPLDTINGTTGNDSITLTQDNLDPTQIDWTIGASSGKMAISDPNGLTINGNGGSDTITLNYTGGTGNHNPLPNLLKLNQTQGSPNSFTISGFQNTVGLAGTTIDINRSTVFFFYGTGASPLSLIQGYLASGYNSGKWTSTATTGVITSTPAANNAIQTTAIGYADSADGLISGQPTNTVELKYTLYGDTTLSGTVGSNDFTTLTLHYHQTTGGTWDTGDFNYDGSINFNDFTLLTRTYNTSLGSQATPTAAGTSNAPATNSKATSTASGSTQSHPSAHQPPKQHKKRR